MANLARIRSEWTGPGLVGPAVSTFFTDETDTGFVANIGSFWDAVKALIPAGISITTQNSGDLIDVATGALSGTWTDGSTVVVTTSAAGAFTLGAGGRVEWATSGIRNGRRVRGSTFIVPLSGGAYSNSGLINGTFQTTMNGAASALRTAMGTNFKVYSRPGPTGAGQANTVIGSDVSTAVSWLRSRRT